ncbi:MAG: glycosyl transferase [Acidobacteria bacterium]|nr:MAG: glycosyl transferase [Acidobacteriota bacterium]
MTGAFDLARPKAAGKFICVGEEKLYIRGVTYGTFRPNKSGNDFDFRVAAADLAQMSANGVNAIRTYTPPPRWFLDLAHQRGLRVMVGIPWEQHVTFLDDRTRIASIEHRLRLAVRSCAGHPAVLFYAIGNEIPSSIVRWYGHRRIEKFLERLYRIAKAEDPGALITYVNYPTTEYLDLPFLDLMCFNVYLESREPWERYLARLQNLAGERPLILAEIGLDSRRNGEDGQAHTLDWQVRSAFSAGCAGAFVFGWTDEWHRGGFDIEDWDFGVTRRDRTPKPALATLRRAFAEAPFPAKWEWPRISVVVCTYNGHRTIRDCLNGLSRLRYPNFEVIVVDDGSTTPMEPIVSAYGFRTIRTPNQGLSAARNVGMEAATGEIVAYLDDDARPDPDWLAYLGDAFLRTSHVGIGGPNLAPPGDGRIADCVANAPGGPVHVLLSDDVAEHIPGCNMAFRTAALKAAGGFDPQFRVAGDDVDLCWRLQERGGTLGFCPAAMVWHHRRNSIRAYWRQQLGYGRAEALLEHKWPEKYNCAGHLSWAGRIYGKGLVKALGQVSRVYRGTWGLAPFQRLYQNGPNGMLSLLLMPEWYLILLGLGLLAMVGRSYEPLWIAWPVFLLATATPLLQAWRSAGGATFLEPPQSALAAFGLRMLTAFLYVLQPIARLSGRMRYGLSPLRSLATGFCAPRPIRHQIWSETWRAPAQWLEGVERVLRAEGAAALRGGDFDEWDFEVPGGMLGSCRLRMAVEEHGAGRQLIRLRSSPRYTPLVVALLILLAAGAADAALSEARIAFAFLATFAMLVAVQVALQCGAALAAIELAVQHLRNEQIEEWRPKAAEQKTLQPMRAQLEHIQ